MSSRREFLGQLVGGVAYVAASRAALAQPALGANDRIRFGLIGAGDRGKELLKYALRCLNVEAVAVADVYTRRLEEAKAIAPAAKTYKDFRHLLDDKSIDAVLIATPQHQHALNFVPAIEAGKDVYQEKTMAFNPDHARRMQKVFTGSGRVVQVGIQSTSSPNIGRIQEMVAAKQFGSIATIQATHYRSARYGSWARMPLAECDAQHIDWAAFEGEAEHHDFDPQRYLNWRFYWDYSGFNCFENMVHQVGFWYKVLDLDIPQSATMSGGNFHSPKMEGPDTIAVSLIQAEKLLFSWTSMFGNGYLGEGGEYLLGTGGTLRRDPSDRITYIPHGKKMEGEVAPPRNTDHTDVNIAHVQNFFDCVRSRKEPNCPFELGLRSAVAGQMAIASYRQQRMVRWDAHAQEIV